MLKAMHPPSDTPDASGNRPSRIVAFPPTRTPKRRSHNLPVELSSFVGRERELDEVKRLLAETRLLTLIGPGGCGKTRLALKVSADLTEEFEDGIWWVGLASLAEPELVPQTVARVLNVRETPGRSSLEALGEHLGCRKILLLLDNCEHLVDSCATLADVLLRSCPQLGILVTSREALGITGESAWLVPSLSLPDPRHPPNLENLGRYGAVRLFVERARGVVSDFALTEGNASAVMRLCQRLDGIPLAIELAAARTRVLSAEQISERLENPLKLLTAGSRVAPPRHRTLRATLEWSHELLSEPEQELFGRLSVFAGGWTLEGAEAVGAGDGIEEEDVLDLLGRLVDKSLVVAEGGADGGVRYGMLEPIRQYGRERLEESGEAEAILSRHADFFLALAERAAPGLRGPRQGEWLKRLEREHDNLSAATVWLLGKGELEEVVRLGWALWLFWWIRSHLTEGRRWMEEALARGIDMPASLRAKALFVSGTMADLQADRQAAEPMLEESLGLFRELEDKQGAAYALGSAGLVAVGQERHEEGIAFLKEGANLFLEVGERWGAAVLLIFSAVGWFRRGDHERAKRLAEQGLALSRKVGYRNGAFLALYTLARIADASSDQERARHLFGEGLQLATETENEIIVAYCLQGLAAISASEGNAVRAARLWGAAEALLEEIEAVAEAAAYPYAPDRSLYESQLSAALHRMGEEAFAATWAEGRAMALEQAIEYALDETPPTPVPAATTSVPALTYPAGLSGREAEVLKLVAKGLTSAQIAEELSISPHTVNRHLNSIYQKLGVSSRAAATRFAIERGLA